MYKEEPDNDVDSGWRFFSGFETDEYVNNPKNIEVYDVNTIVKELAINNEIRLNDKEE